MYESNNVTEEGVSVAALKTAQMAGLTGVKRAFRYAGKFEQRHMEYGLHLWYEVSVEGVGASQMENIILYVQNMTDIAHVNAEPEVALEFVPNDVHYTTYQQTYMNAIKMESAWDYTLGSPNVVINVVDGGVHINHVDYGHPWVNSGEICDNGLDDDNNGFVDDCFGYNFWLDNEDVMGYSYLANNYHGQWSASTAAAGLDNSHYISGIAGNGTQIMPTVTFGSFYHHGYQAWMIGGAGFREAIIYAADMGADISSNSWTFNNGMQDASVLQAIQYFKGLSNKNVVIAAAGNENTQNARYPAAHAEVISVAATGGTSWFHKASFSNYGSWIDISAPGHMILVTSFVVSDPDGQPGTGDEIAADTYGFVSGTSFSCPMVAGAVALMRAYAPSKTASEIESCIMSTAQTASSTGLGAGIIDVEMSLSCLGGVAPIYSPGLPPSSPPPPTVPHPALPPSSPPMPSCTSDVVLDNDISTLTGSWSVSTSSNQYYGTYYVHDQNTDKGNKYVTYMIPSGTVGEYIVKEMHSAVTNWRATNVKITVVSTSGNTDYIVNQEINGGTFNALGPNGGDIHTFSIGSKIVVHNVGTTKHVVADAFMLECVAPPSPPPVVPSPMPPPLSPPPSPLNPPIHLHRCHPLRPLRPPRRLRHRCRHCLHRRSQIHMIIDSVSFVLYNESHNNSLSNQGTTTIYQNMEADGLYHGAYSQQSVELHKDGEYRIRWYLGSVPILTNFAVGIGGSIDMLANSTSAIAYNVTGSGMLEITYTCSESGSFYFWFFTMETGSVHVDSVNIQLLNMHEIADSIAMQDPVFRRRRRC